MVKEIERTYRLSQRDVRQAVVDWLKAKGMPAPGYLADTKDTSWIDEPDGGVTVVWAEKEDVE